MGATSLSDSQNSSLNESSKSQTSHIRAGLIRDLDRSQGDRFNEEMTPSTSLSNNSSQEVVGKARSSDYDGVLPVEGCRPTYTSAARSQPDRSRMLHMEHTSAPKRMANGEIKSPAYSLPNSPVEISQYGHSRNSSRTSRSSQIGELSSQLQTCLSYAMVKVQNGWQSNNINGLEVMTSNQASPVSAMSDQKRSYESAPAKAGQTTFSASTQPSKRIAIANGFDDVSPQATTPYPDRGYVRPRSVDTTQDPPSHQVGAAYESFWREHEGVSALKNPEASGSPIRPPYLAPPVDLVPRNRRRPDTSKRQLPILHTKDLLCAESQLNSALPTVPPPTKGSKMRTPSQQAAVEKDAVETLLFMSSPSNSICHPRATLPGAPLRNEFAFHAIQADHAGTLRQTEGIGHRRTFPMLRLTRHSRIPLSDAELDKVLDEMSDTSSSDDDDLQENGPSPREQRS